MMNPLTALVAIAAFYTIAAGLVGFFVGYQWHKESEDLWTEDELNHKLRNNE